LWGIHQPARDLYEIGGIDAAKIKEVDEACLISGPKTDREAEKSPNMGRFSPAVA
jgi:hypothetical protein